MWQSLMNEIQQGSSRALARAISFIENEQAGYEDLLRQLRLEKYVPVIGITGAPGSGKSTLTDALVGALVSKGERVAVLCVDPSSPFNRGAILGDRIRMSDWYLHPSVFIRSLASRGSLGGLHPKIIEITELLRAVGFDRVLVETVGVGQSEIEIAGLADTTIVVLVPEGGDEIQTMKSGVMEIADIFVVNKADRPGADQFVKNLRQMTAPAFSRHIQEVPVLKTIASEKTGIQELVEKINQLPTQKNKELRSQLFAERAYHVIQQKRMSDISKSSLTKAINTIPSEDFNLYRFVDAYLNDTIFAGAPKNLEGF